ncbi:hypothetical protein CIB95_08960 [Lottiidibacillus patelloidae]|uniref:DarT domain-containing protein n=1 Tax=Lottiidibacillus patelloidae TaxID=2670334 RepID=A0A263BT42_9BACI|nr:DarT ssDNA thymidine ADP-ribosyltransferase family protein [Lottiidibacillus patelloidae]OZM56890.1 hypothetical protein CIB95_08960 [Lottiidibacillus patelloidae]
MYKVGERIEHIRFGPGEIIEVSGDKTCISIIFTKGFGYKKFRLKEANKYIIRLSEFCIFDEETNDWYNLHGYNEDGYDKYGYDQLGYDSNGFNRDKLHKVTKTHFNQDGYNYRGYKQDGFNQKGIHKETNTIYNLNGYDVNGVHASEELVKVINQKVSPKCELKFDGFYHMTHFDNAASILKDGKIFSRSRQSMKVDMNKKLDITNRVISYTHANIQDHVRMYFRPKTPTFWYFENFSEIVLLKFSSSLLTLPRAKVSIGNAGNSSSVICDITKSTLNHINFNSLFLSSEVQNKEEMNLRHTELLIPEELELSHLDSIIFRSNKDLLAFKNKFGHHKGVLYQVNKAKFFYKET